MHSKIFHYGFVDAVRRDDRRTVESLEIEAKEFQDVGVVEVMPDKCFPVEALEMKLGFECVCSPTNTHAANSLDILWLDSKYFDRDLS